MDKRNEKDKRDILSDAVGCADGKFIEEAAARREDRKKRRGLYKVRGTAAACALLAVGGAVLAIPALRGRQTPPAVTDITGTTAAVTESDETEAPALTGPVIIFAGDYAAGGETARESASLDTEDAIFIGYTADRSVYFDLPLEKALEGAADDDVFAFTVSVFGDFPLLDTDAVTKEHELCEGRFMEIAERVTDRIAAERGIGRLEAAARKFTDPEFIAAREKYHGEKKAYQAAWVKALAENVKDGMEVLSGYGLMPLYGAENVEYCTYLYNKSASCVMTATKRQLEELAAVKLGYEYLLSAACEHAADLPVPDFYTGGEVELPEDGKTAKDAMAELEKTEGGVRVLCVVNYTGPEYATREELDAATLAAIGMTAEEFDYAVDANNDAELVDRYLAARRELIYHNSFYEGVAERLLLDGELEEIRGWQCGFVAVLTRERAETVSRDAAIAYIRK